MRRTLATASLALLLLALAQPAAAPETITLRLTITAPTVKKLSVNTVNEAAYSGAALGTNTSTIKVLQQYAFQPGENPGEVKITVTNESAEVSIQGDALGADPTAMAADIRQTTLNFTVDPRGQILATEAKAAGEMAQVATLIQSITTAGYNGLVFPENPIAPNDTWQTIIDMGKAIPPSAEGIEVKEGILPVVYTFLRTESRDGKTFAIVQAKIEGTVRLTLPIGFNEDTTMVIASQTTYTVDTATGIVHAYSSQAETTVDLGIVQIKNKATINATPAPQ